MTAARESAAVVALLRLNRRPQVPYAELVQAPGSALAVLERALSEADRQGSLMPVDAGPLLTEAEADIAGWSAAGMRLVTVLDDDYPLNLRAVHDRPVALFIAGRLEPSDTRSVAVIGARRASHSGLASARAIAEHLVQAGYTVVSGLAAGIDTAAHRAALSAGGRSIAVLGTGLSQTYPPENAELQRVLADRCAVVSQFWPDAPPNRHTFPLRNATMSGLSLATVVVEASQRSGARIQARLALGHGRPVFLARPLLAEPWAREFARRPGTQVFASPEEITASLAEIVAAGALIR